MHKFTTLMREWLQSTIPLYVHKIWGGVVSIDEIEDAFAELKIQGFTG